MNRCNNIETFAKLGNYLLDNPEELQAEVHRAYVYNNWFTKKNTEKALFNIATYFLNAEKLTSWLKNYTLPSTDKVKTIAIVSAGNIPLVAFHDILCVLITGNKLQLKLSEKDKILLPFLLNKLIEIDQSFSDKIEYCERLKNFDAIIATGSNTAAQHFQYYFGKYKNIIRKHRNAVAILDGTDTIQDIEALSDDIFDFFGLGCRNVSKIYVPENMDLEILKIGFEKQRNLMEHTQYMNNLDYQRTIYLMNQIPMLDVDFINIVENKSLYSPIACLHYERYKHKEEVENNLKLQQENIQCIIGKDTIPFGKSQQPSLSDYADNVDTLEFILSV